MKPFRYERANDERGAVATLAATPGAKFLAGGTNLVDLMRLGVETPELLVDVRRLPYDRIEARDDGGLRIGAGVRNSDLAADSRVRSGYPALAEALLAGASGQLRNLATTGGNLLQRTRCAYFQDVTKPCNKREPGSGCPAREGEHRNLAVIGHSEHCVATHPSDMAVALAAFDAIVRVVGPAGVREIPLVDFHRLPGDTPERDTVLAREELIAAVELPPTADRRQLGVSQGARARLVLVRARLGRRGDRRRRRQGRRRSHRVRRVGAQAVACVRGGAGAARLGGRRSGVRVGGRRRARAGRAAAGQRLQGRARTQDARAHAGGARRNDRAHALGRRARRSGRRP